MLPGSDLRHIPEPGDALIWAADPEDDDVLIVAEYWQSIYDLGGGNEAEAMANFTSDAKHLIAEWTDVLEAAPVWVQGLAEPAGWQQYAEDVGNEPR